MKKLLSVLGALTVGSTAALTVVSCSAPVKVIPQTFKTDALQQKDFLVWDESSHAYKEDTEAFEQWNKLDASEKAAKNIASLNGSIGKNTFSNFIADATSLLTFNPKIYTTTKKINKAREIFRTDLADKDSTIFSADGVYIESLDGTKSDGSKGLTRKEYYDNYAKNAQEEGKSEHVNSLTGMYEQNYDDIVSGKKNDDESEFLKSWVGAGKYQTLNSSITGMEYTSGFEAYNVNSTLFDSTKDPSTVTKEIVSYNNANYNKDAKADGSNAFTGQLKYAPADQMVLAGATPQVSAPVDTEATDSTKTRDAQPAAPAVQFKQVDKFEEKFQKFQGEIEYKKLDDSSTQETTNSTTKEEAKKYTSDNFNKKYSILQPVSPFKMTYTYNTDVDLKKGTELGDQYKIDVEMKNVYAVYRPQIGKATVKPQDGASGETEEKLQIFWVLEGYQFNNEFDSYVSADGTTALKPNIAVNKKFKDANFDIKIRKTTSEEKTKTDNSKI